MNAELRVGALEETITVTGAPPTVDVQNVVQQRVMTRDVIDAIPVGARSAASLGVLIPGVTTNNQDVGGSAFSSAAIAIHGSRLQEQQQLYDGMHMNNGQGRGGNFVAIATNDATIQEISLETAGLSAESELSGIRTNVIPKEGGNAFRGTFATAFTNSSLQSDNLGPDLQALGLRSVPRVNKVYDINPAVGGPIARDKVWFFASIRNWAAEQSVAGLYYNLTPTGRSYNPDFSRQAENIERNGNQSLRLTWQVNCEEQDQPPAPERAAGSAVLRLLVLQPVHLFARSHLRVEVDSVVPLTGVVERSGHQPAPARGRRGVCEQGLRDLPAAGRRHERALVHGAVHQHPLGQLLGRLRSQRAATTSTRAPRRSYVTGAHSAKVGVTFMRLSAHTTQDVVNDGVTLQLLNGQPRQITVFATPLTLDEVTKANVGLFAQDQWTLRRMTINAGVRYDYFNSYVPAQTIGPGPQVPSRNISFPAVENVPNWTDVSPRLGVSYDLFGTGRTAVKASIGRYLEGPNLTAFTRQANPANAIVTSATRTWSDANGDFVAAGQRAWADQQRQLRPEPDHDPLRRRRDHPARLQLGRRRPASSTSWRPGCRCRSATTAAGSATSA